MSALGQNDSVLVIGDGAVGTALAWQIARRGLVVQVEGRGGARCDPLLFKGIDGVLHRIIPEKGGSPRAAGMVMIAVKVYDLADVLAKWMPLIGAVPCVIFCNGNWESIIKTYETQPRVNLRWGTCTLGVSADEQGVFCQTSEKGAFIWGPPDKLSKSSELITPLEEKLTTDGLSSSSTNLGVTMGWTPGMRWNVRKKWLFNTVINTACAFYRLPNNGALLEKLADVEAYFAEAMSLGTYLFKEDWPVSRDDAWRDLCALVQATRNNENSMARDVRLGRKTEVTFLAGLASEAPAQFPRLAAAARVIDGESSV
jgi:ketopantoate reductase